MSIKERKLNRYKYFDYTSDNLYFVTICTQDRKEYFGEIDIKEAKMILNKFGKTIEQQWLWLAENFNYIRLDEWTVMPNHIHGIIIIDRFNYLLENDNRNVGTGLDLSLQNKDQKILSLSNIIGAFKTTSSKLIHQNGFLNFHWQRSFYDRVIRSQKELENIRHYIYYNPTNWAQDRNNPKNIKI